jgi:WD40 repeat protein
MGCNQSLLPIPKKHGSMSTSLRELLIPSIRTQFTVTEDDHINNNNVDGNNNYDVQVFSSMEQSEIGTNVMSSIQHSSSEGGGGGGSGPEDQYKTSPPSNLTTVMEQNHSTRNTRKNIENNDNDDDDEIVELDFNDSIDILAGKKNGSSENNTIPPSQALLQALLQQGLSNEDASLYTNKLVTAGLCSTYDDINALSEQRIRSTLQIKSKLHISAILRAALVASFGSSSGSIISTNNKPISVNDLAQTTTSTTLAMDESSNNNNNNFQQQQHAKKSSHYSHFITSYDKWESTTLPYHSGVVWQISFHPRGHEFYSVSEDGKIGVWQQQQQQQSVDSSPNNTDQQWICKKGLEYNKESVKCVDASETCVSCGGDNGSILLFEANEPHSLIFSIENIHAGSTTRAICLNSKHNPELILSGDSTGRLCITSISSATVLCKLTSLHTSSISDVLFLSPDLFTNNTSCTHDEITLSSPVSATYFASVSWDCTVKIVKITNLISDDSITGTGKQQQQQLQDDDNNNMDNNNLDIEVKLNFKSHTKDARAIVVFSDGLHACTASEDSNILLWEFSTGKIIQREGHNSWVTCMGISPCETLIVSGGLKTMIVWSVSSIKSVNNGSTHIKQGNTILEDSSSRKLTKVREIEAFSNWLKCIAFHPYGESLITSSEERLSNIKVWRVNST